MTTTVLKSIPKLPGAVLGSSPIVVTAAGINYTVSLNLTALKATLDAYYQPAFTLAAGVATWLATPSSGNLRTAVTDETGTGALVFGTAPTLSGAVIDGPSITVNSGNPPFLTYKATGINFNSANTDTAIPINLPTGFTRFTVSRVMISHASGTLTTSTFGVFTAAAGGGTAIVAGGTANTISTAAEGTNNNTMLNAASNTTSYLLVSVPNIYFRVQTAQGVAATADVIVVITPLP